MSDLKRLPLDLLLLLGFYCAFAYRALRRLRVERFSAMGAVGTRSHR